MENLLMNRIFGIIQIYWLYLYETDFKDYELLRFSVQRSIFERWRMLKYQLLEEKNQTHFEKFQNLHTKFREHYIEIMAHLNLLRQNDGLGPVHLIRPPSKTPFKTPFKAPFSV